MNGQSPETRDSELLDKVCKVYLLLQAQVHSLVPLNALFCCLLPSGRERIVLSCGAWLVGFLREPGKLRVGLFVVRECVGPRTMSRKSVAGVTNGCRRSAKQGRWVSNEL